MKKSETKKLQEKIAQKRNLDEKLQKQKSMAIAIQNRKDKKKAKVADINLLEERIEEDKTADQVYLDAIRDVNL